MASNKQMAETYEYIVYELDGITYIPDYKTFLPFVLLSEKIIRQEIKDSSKGSSYFHHINMPNQWGMKPRTVINNHVFY